MEGDVCVFGVEQVVEEEVEPGGLGEGGEALVELDEQVDGGPLDLSVGVESEAYNLNINDSMSETLSSHTTSRL